ncbi:hypothetical protein KI387_033970 [Taxus chinensis]|uniref:Uncharacterized protein n=1 Tax=Taxus chinensis TaxID=29808 RepID=A0AA38F4V3_TAXCH|nr:hypothetical protein KI387_033970 [Taxus chinensis]
MVWDARDKSHANLAEPSRNESRQPETSPDAWEKSTRQRAPIGKSRSRPDGPKENGISRP